MSTDLTKIDNLTVLTKAEIDVQISTAKAYPRDLKRCIDEACALVSINQEIAEGCIYSVPRAGKMLTGASIRLAEIMIYCWTNIHCSTRLVKNDGKFISVEGLIVDRERNIVYSEIVERSIMTSSKDGKQPKQYSIDMQQTAAAAAASIALRKAAFRLFKPFLPVVYEAAKKAAIGEVKSTATKTQAVVARLQKMGASLESILSFLNVEKIEEITHEQLEHLIGIGTSLKEGYVTIENAFNKNYIGDTGELLPNKADEVNSKLLGQAPIESNDSLPYI